MPKNLTFTKDIGGFKRGTGLLVIEVRNSNPNGDPDRESDPRQRPDRRGEISPVSYKRKLRDLVEWKGDVWSELANRLTLDISRFGILEARGRDRKLIAGQLTGDGQAFKDAYWDGRVFGNTFLESMKDEDAKKQGFSEQQVKEFKANAIKTGVVHFGLGLSVAPIDIERHTNTNKAGVEDDKLQGMAPMAYRFVPHGIYLMPFFVNPSAAAKTGCTGEDIAMMLELIRYAYPHTRSHARPAVDLVKAWYVEHADKLGSCSDFAILDALTPTKLGDAESPSKSLADYTIPADLPDELKNKKDRDGQPALNLIDLL
ncbi:MAG: type I CRISPR-associated protein Cas7 [Thiohalomonadaceae bacterium]